MAPQPIPKLKPVYRPRPPSMKRKSGPLEEGFYFTTKKFLKLIFLPPFPKRTYIQFVGQMYIGEKEVIRSFRAYWKLALK
jgi:hypothetical protein